MATTPGYLGALYEGDGATYTASSSWTEITQVTDLTPPTFENDTIDITHLKSSDFAREFRKGWGDAGELSATLQYTESAYSDLLALAVSGEIKGWKVEFNDDADGGTSGTTDGGVGFTGFVQSVAPPLDSEGLVTIDLTLKLTGKPTSITAVTV